MAARGVRWFAVGALTYAVVRVVAFAAAGTRDFPDSGAYESMAEHPLFTLRVVAGVHAPVVPLFYRVVGTGDVAFAAQLALSIACWLALAASVAASLRHPVVRAIGFAVPLAFSLHRELLLWDTLVLSESVALSLSAALVAAWLHVARRMTPVRLALAVALTGLWILARDPHAYVAVLLAAGLLVAALLRSDGRRLRVLAAAAILAACAASFVSSSIGYKRWQFRLQNVVTERIVDDPGDLRWFEDAGMPVTPEFLERAREPLAPGELRFLHPRQVLFEPETPPGPFAAQRWIMEEGRTAYTRFLVTHPGYVARSLGELDRSLLDPRVRRYAPDPPPEEVPVLPALVHPPGTAGPLVLALLALGLGGVALRRGLYRPEWLVPLALIAGSLPFAMLAWLGDSIELDRHSLIGALSLRLGALILLLFAVDGLLRARHVKMARS